MADGTILQSKTPYPDGIRHLSCADVFVHAEATMPWCGRSGPSNTDPSECRLTEEASLWAIFASSQYAIAAQTDPLSAFKSTSTWQDALH